MARKEATATLRRIAADGALTDAWCRSLVREGADVGAILLLDQAAAQDVVIQDKDKLPLRWLPRAAGKADGRGSVTR